MAVFSSNTLFVAAALCVAFCASLPVRNTRSAEASIVKRVQEGHGIELDCTVKGKSPIVYHWLHDGELFEQSSLESKSTNIIAPRLAETGEDSDYYNAVVGRLVIPHVTLAHSGKYTCVADTGVDRITESHTVEVIPNKDETEPVEDELRIYQITKKVLQNEGKPVHLVCRATQGLTKDTPTVIWTLNGQPILNDLENGIQVHSNGDLTISSLTMNYHSMLRNIVTCNASNDSGHVVSESTWIYVAPK